MPTRRILTPTLLDAPVPGLDRLVQTGGWTLNAPPLPAGDQLARTGRVLTALAALVEATAKAGERPVLLGGDCCQPIAVMAGLTRAGIRPMLLWLDAHGDFNTHDTTISGFLGGMPLAMLTGRGRQELVRAAGLQEPIADSEVVLADARTLDPKEAEALAASTVARFASIHEAIAVLPPDRPVYVHVDVDVIDAADLPATLYPEPGGPSAADVTRALAHLRDTRAIAAVSMTSWAPARDADRRAERLCLELLDTVSAPSARSRGAR